MGLSPTQLSLRDCRRRLWPAAVVEKWNQWARVRQDLFGGIDLVVLDDQPGVLGVQATSDSNVAARVTKLKGLLEGALGVWLSRGNRLQVWGWRKIKNRWHARYVPIDLPAPRTV